MELENFIQKYGKPAFLYKEFLECKITDKSIYDHQEFLKRYLGNIYNDSNEILLFHEMGVGKTCTSVKIVEHLLNYYPGEYKGAIILSRGQGLIQNFISEIAYKCTNNKYLTKKSEISEKLTKFRIKKNIMENYNFFTFEIFSKILRDLNDTMILTRFNSYIIILDEVHNIRDLEYKTNVIYNQIHRFLHLLTHRKIILMTGTPMKDTTDEIASLMNLILPLNQQMNVGTFNHRYFSNQNLQNEKELGEFFKNRVSFLKSYHNQIPKVFAGNVIAPLEHFKIIHLPMHALQNEAYERAWRFDSENISIYSNSRQASLYVDKDLQFGKNCKVMTSEIEKYSCKYHYLIERLKQTPNELSLVYADFVKGSGLLLLAKILENYGFTSEINNPNAFIVLTSKMSEIRKQYYIDQFNSRENARGQCIQILIGSRVIMEGYTFKNILHEHILTPHWNYSETSQVIARGWRNSHQDLIEMGLKPILTVYQYAAIPSNFPSIDLIMYKTSEQKDKQISQIIDVMKKSAIDCYIFKERNIQGEDYSRECQYKKCNFICNIEPNDNDEIITKNYDIEYYKFSKEWDRDLAYIKYLFTKEWAYKWDDIYSLTSSITRIQLVKLLSHLKNRFIFLRNPFGNFSHLQYDNTGVYLIIPYKRDTQFYSYILGKYEQYGYRNFNNIMENSYWKNISYILNDFASNDNVQFRINIIVHMPQSVQKILLRNALKLGVKLSQDPSQDTSFHNQANVASMYNTIYNHFKTSIFENDSYIGYYLNEEYWCISKSSFLEVDSTIVKDYFKMQKEMLENNTLGYYGQENRNLNEFCIKIVEKDIKSDKRKIHSGRRCVNWNKLDLIQLLKKMNKDVDHISSRKDMCSIIQNYFKENRLIENNDTCGTQYKKK